MHFTDAFDLNKKTSLYIHVPFCLKKCSYCAFYSKTCNSKQIENYFNRLIQEAKTIVDLMQGKPFYTIYLGGGNPGCLSVEQLEILLSIICKNGRPEECSVEMNPESFTFEHFKLFEKYFTRLSMGVQSLNARALKFLGRNADLTTTGKALDLAMDLRDKFGTLLNFDLITCLPQWHDYLSDVRELVDIYSPDHLSVYALTLEEGTPLYRQNPSLPDSDRQFDILSDIWSLLDSYGYSQYEVSNFARNGHISLHNSVYWDYQQYIGLGPAAASSGFKDGKVYRAEACRDIDLYSSNDVFSGYSITELKDDEALEEFVLMGLRHTRGLNLKRLKSEFGKEITQNVPGFNVVGDCLVPDKNGLMTADWAASKLLSCIDS